MNKIKSKTVNTMSTMMDNKKMLTVNEPAASISFSRRSFYRAIAAGELQVFRFGKMSRIRVEDLDAFIERHLTKSGEIQ